MAVIVSDALAKPRIFHTYRLFGWCINPSCHLILLVIRCRQRKPIRLIVFVIEEKTHREQGIEFICVLDCRDLILGKGGPQSFRHRFDMLHRLNADYWEDVSRLREQICKSLEIGSVFQSEGKD